MDRWQENQRQREAMRNSDAFRTAPKALADTVFDLEARGLLQYDRQVRRYDLHPVVRGVAAGGLESADRDQYGQRVVDHFSRRAHDPWENAQTLDDLSIGLTLVRTLVRLGRFQHAFDAYDGDLSLALRRNLTGYNEVLSLLRPFLNRGLTALPDCVSEEAAVNLAEEFAGALYRCGHEDQAMALMQPAILRDLEQEDWRGLTNRLGNTAYVLEEQNRLAAAERVASLSMELAMAVGIQIDIFRRHIDALARAVILGNWDDAESAWQQVEKMGRAWPRDRYSPGTAEMNYAEYRLRRGDLREELLVTAEALARSGKSHRLVVKNVHYLRAEWYGERGEWELVATHTRELIRMEREEGNDSRAWEPQLTLALMKLGKLENPRGEVENLPEGVDDVTQAKLWLALGEREKALGCALSAYRYAWADGEPYVRRQELDQARGLLEELGAAVPNLPPYDPARDPKFDWEDAVSEAIERLRRTRHAEEPE